MVLICIFLMTNDVEHFFIAYWPFPLWNASSNLLPIFNFFKFFQSYFLMWTIFKVFIEFITILLLFYVLVFWPRGMWDLSSPTRDRTRIPCIVKWSPNHWTTREVPCPIFSGLFILIIEQQFFIYSGCKWGMCIADLSPILWLVYLFP